MGLELMGKAGQLNLFFYFFVYFALPLSLLLTYFSFKKQKDAFGEKLRELDSRQELFIYIPLAILFLVVSIALFFEGFLMYMSFYLMSFGILLVIALQYLRGRENGIDAKNKESKALSKIISYGSFVYFVIKIILEAYKAINTTDPFIILKAKDFSANNTLGSVLPMLQNYGIPDPAINIIALIFNDYVAIIILGITFLKTAFKKKGNIYGKINAGVIIVYMWFVVDIIRFPFFTMVLSMLYVSGWFLGNMYGSFDLSGVLDEL
jgi:hypothetical protein